MKIVFDLTPLYDHLTGIERYNLNIAKSMIEQYPEAKYVLLFKNEVHTSFKKIVSYKNVSYKVIPSCNKLIFIQWRLLKVLNKINADYYLFLSFTSPVFFRKKRIINAIHDLTCWDCPETIPAKMVYYYRLTYSIAAKRSWKIITVSHFSQSRLCKKYHLNSNQVPIIYNGLTAIFKNKKSCQKDIYREYRIPKHYYLCLSTLEPRKNLKLLITAYSDLIKKNKKLPDLVLAGRYGWKLNKILDGIGEKAKNKIHFTGFVDDKDLPLLYRNADLFIFPSKYEGFGLPIIESMSQGTIVLSSDAASLPEVVKDGGIMFKSNDSKDLEKKLLNFAYLDSNIKEAVKIKAYKIAESYDWSTEASKLYRIMEQANED